MVEMFRKLTHHETALAVEDHPTFISKSLSVYTMLGV